MFSLSFTLRFPIKQSRGISLPRLLKTYYLPGTLHMPFPKEFCEGGSFPHFADKKNVAWGD